MSSPLGIHLGIDKGESQAYIHASLPFCINGSHDISFRERENDIIKVDV